MRYDLFGFGGNVGSESYVPDQGIPAPSGRGVVKTCTDTYLIFLIIALLMTSRSKRPALHSLKADSYTGFDELKQRYNRTSFCFFGFPLDSYA